MVVSRHRVYEHVSRDEENAFLREAMAIVGTMSKPRGWTRRKGKGRPGKRDKGRPPEFDWRAMVVILLLMQFLGLGFRNMASHVAARPELMKMLGLDKAPSKSSLHRAHQVLSQG